MITYGTFIALGFLLLAVIYTLVVTSNERRVTRFQKEHLITNKGRENKMDDDFFAVIIPISVFFFFLSLIATFIIQIVSMLHHNISLFGFVITFGIIWITLSLTLLTSLFHQSKFLYKVSIFFNLPLLDKYKDITGNEFGNSMFNTTIKSKSPILKKISKINKKLIEWNLLLTDIELFRESQKINKTELKDGDKQKEVYQKSIEKLKLLESEIAMRFSEAESLWNSSTLYKYSEIMEQDTTAYERLMSAVGEKDVDDKTEHEHTIEVKEEPKEVTELRQLMNDKFNVSESFKTNNMEKLEEYNKIKKLAEATLVEILDKLESEGQSKELDNLIRETTVIVKTARQKNNLE